jgi:indolepyruvate ferredoxin oxidoreductase alpha subunit
VVVDTQRNQAELEKILLQALAGNELWVIIARSPCVLAAKRIRQYEKEAQEQGQCGGGKP